LIDFWAGWCGPCRKENPNVVKLYDAYKNKGFDIYGVSLDRNLSSWKSAIEKDGIVWPQVSDLQSWNSPVTKAYNITGIPNTILIDRQGRIIKKDFVANN
ncbi:MAG: TlpA family protein disulfide reductase, partial [Bacteroidales bacterium]|nr:TlpA family protein disulfide reductase [Bacteroidales bacterium]